jgi:glutathione S-transferase
MSDDGAMSPLPAPYVFHAFEISYFSAKVRVALRAKGLWFVERRADLGEIVRRTGLAFVPILVTPEGETWQDSSEIVDRLEVRHPEPPLLPASPVQRIAALLVELYADEFGTIPAMHYRWGSPLGEATARARFAAMIGDAQAARKAADRMAAARLALGASDAAAPAIEAHTRDLLDALGEHFSEHPYLLGARPSLADCALMGPIYGHFFNDLVSRRLLLESAVPVVGWIERCQAPDPEDPGGWLAGDVLAPAFREVLAVMGRDAAPVVLASVAAIEKWADEPRGLAETPPRVIGRCEPALRGVVLRRVVQPYTLWMLQRTLDAYRALAPHERDAVDAALAGTGWEPLLACAPRHRLGKRAFQLVFEPAPV